MKPALKNTTELTVFSNSQLQENNIVIHPNDGFDLGFMQFSEGIEIQVNENNGQSNGLRSMAGSIILENDCKPGTIQLNPKLWHHIGKPVKIILILKESTLFVVNR